MRPPIFFSVRCPDCGRSAGISAVHAGLYYLADQGWGCPYCKETHTTEELHEQERLDEAKTKNDE